MNEAALIELKQRGWMINDTIADHDLLPRELVARYPKLPDSLVDFLSRFSLCANASETAWFLSAPDYHGSGNSAFRWNEWELLSLDAARGNTKAAGDIRRFWDAHFPFMVSVHSGYEFHAVCVEDHCFGRVVKGREPEFEATQIVADSFDSFLATLIRGDLNV